MKKYKILFIILLFLGTYNLTGATYTSSNNGYSNVKDYDFEFNLENTGDKVVLKWDKFEKEDFKYYKIVKSISNPNPAYPEDGYIKYSTDIGFTEYADYSKIYKTTYYRICAITNEKNRYCSKVKKALVSDSYTSTTTTTNNSYDISNTLKLKADNIIDSFISKMKDKDYSNEKIVSKIDYTIGKLKKLKEQKPSLKYLISYFITKLEEKRSDYEDDLYDIEAIFDL